jgi:carbon-monoxide dehydrogenase medium subunit
MYPAKFDYYRASSVAEAVALLQEHGDAKILAGGHSLIPAMKLRLATPAALIDIGTIGDLRGIGMVDGAVRIGAMTTYAEVARSTRDHALHDCCAHVGDAQVRNRGTVGGSLAHNDPSGDMPAVALALEATLEIAGPDGVRYAAADEFLTGLFETTLSDTEILTAIHFPNDIGGSAYEKVANPASGYAVAGVAAAVNL